MVVEPAQAAPEVKAAEQNTDNPAAVDNAALDAQLAKLLKENTSSADGTITAPDESQPQPGAEPAQDPAPKPEVTPPAPAGTPQEPQPEKKPEPKTLEQIQAENEKLSHQVEEQKGMLQKWGNEVGEIRNLANQTVYPQPYNGVPQAPQVQPAEIDLSDPAQVDALIQQKVDQRYQQQSQVDLQARAQTQQTEMNVRQRHPDFDVLLDDMAKLASERGLPAQNVAIFKRNPFAENVNDLETLIVEVKHKRQISELNTKIDNLGNQGESQLKKIVQVANEEPTVTSNSGGSTAGSQQTVAGMDFPQMSDDELAEAGKHLPKD